jgi:hypothetical protein
MGNPHGTTAALVGHVAKGTVPTVERSTEQISPAENRKADEGGQEGVFDEILPLALSEPKPKPRGTHSFHAPRARNGRADMARWRSEGR